MIASSSAITTRVGRLASADTGLRGGQRADSSAEMRSRRESCSRSSSLHRRRAASRGDGRGRRPGGGRRAPRRRRAGSRPRARGGGRPPPPPRGTPSCSSVTASSARMRLSRSLTSTRRRCRMDCDMGAFYGHAPRLRASRSSRSRAFCRHRSTVVRRHRPAEADFMTSTPARSHRSGRPRDRDDASRRSGDGRRRRRGAIR